MENSIRFLGFRDMAGADLTKKLKHRIKEDGH